MTRWMGLGVSLLVWGLVGCVPSGGRGGSGGDGEARADGAVADGALTDDGVEASDAESTPDVPPAEPGAPRILSLDSDARRLTEGQGLRISAVVTDDDGPEDVLGGVLEDPQGGAYGAFTATGGGTYQVDVDWAALHRVMAITFVGEAERVLWARFFDQAGLETVGALRITMFCAGGGACDGACLDVLADPSNCGGCGVICPAVGEAEGVCVDGACAGLCPGGSTLCGGGCVDLESDVAHCGGCDEACPAIEGGEPVCAGAACGGICPAGGEACDGACVDPATDVLHCGRCGNVCPGDAGRRRCADGRCLEPCAADAAICGGECVDLQRDPENCGGCDRRCPAPAGGEALCADGGCVEGCAFGLTACGGVCVDTGVDIENCGRCGNLCPGAFDCIGGVCELECPPDERACGGECARCPSNGVVDLDCDGDACVATRCMDGFEPFAGGCAPRIREDLGRPPLLMPEPGGYPPIALDLTSRADGRPYLMAGWVLSDGGVVVEAGDRNPEFGWGLDVFNIFDSGRKAIRVGVVALPDGRMVHGYAYDRGDRSDLIGGGMEIRGVGAPVRDSLPGNTGGDIWGFSVAGRLVDGQLRAQMGISLDNPVNRSMSRYDWQGGSLELVDPFINGIVHFTVDAQDRVHFVYQPDYGGDLTWRRGIDFADREVEPVGEPAALLGGVRVGPRGPVVSYARDPDTLLRVATRENGRWSHESVDPADIGGQFWGFDVELDPAGWPVACYWRNGSIYVARRNAAGWQRRRVAAVPGGQTECAVMVDAADGISVAWAHFVTEGGRTTATIHYDGLAPGLP